MGTTFKIFIEHTKALFNGNYKKPISVYLKLMQDDSKQISSAMRLALENLSTENFINLCAKMESSKPKLLEISDDEGMTLLMRAVQCKDQSKVKFLLAKGANITATDKFKRTAMHHALESKNLPIIELLLEYKGVPLLVPDHTGKTPLHLAASIGHLKTLEHALKTIPQFRNAITQLDTEKKVALHYAALAGDEKVIAWLDTHADSWNFYDINGHSPLYYLILSSPTQALQLKSSIKTTALLLRHQCDSDSKQYAIHVASIHGKEAWVKHIIKKALDNGDKKGLLAVEKDGRNAVHLAAMYGQTEVLKSLYQHVPLHIKDFHGKTPLELAIDYLHIENIEWIQQKLALEYGQDEIAQWIQQKVSEKEARLDAEKAPKRDVFEEFLFLQPVKKEAKSILFEDRENYSSSPRIPLAEKERFKNFVTFIQSQNDLQSAHHFSLDSLKNSLDESDSTGLSFIHYACAYQKKEVVEFILKQDPKQANRKDMYLWHWTPLHWAAYTSKDSKQSLEIAKTLINIHSVIVDARSLNDWTPLHLAAAYGTSEFLNFLLSKNADPRAYGQQKWQPLHLTAIHGNTIHMSILLDDARVDYLAVDFQNNTSAHLAAMNGKLATLRLLEEKAKNITQLHIPGHLNRLPIHLAAWHGHLEVVRHILSQEEKISPKNQRYVDVRDQQGLTPLMYTCRVPVFNEVAAANFWTINAVCYKPQNRTEVAKFLLEMGADPKLRDNNDQSIPGEWKWGWTPMHYAAHSGSIEIVELLIKKGVQVDVKAEGGWTPLHEAACYGHAHIVQLLIDNKANLNLQATQGWSPLHLACMRGNLECCRILLSADSATTSIDDNFMTPAHLAACNGHVDILKELFQHDDLRKSNSSINQDNISTSFEVGDCRGRLPIHLAAWHGHLQSLAWLLELFPHHLFAEDKSGHNVLAYASSFPEFTRTMDKEVVFWANTLVHAPLGDKAAVVSYLLAKKIPFAREGNDYADSPLLHATRSNYVHIAILLIKHLMVKISEENAQCTALDTMWDRFSSPFLNLFLDKEFFKSTLIAGNDDIAAIYIYCYYYLKEVLHPSHFSKFEQFLEREEDNIIKERRSSTLFEFHNKDFFLLRVAPDRNLSSNIVSLLLEPDRIDHVLQNCQSKLDVLNRNILHYIVLIANPANPCKQKVTIPSSMLLEKDYRMQTPIHLASFLDNAAIIDELFAPFDLNIAYLAMEVDHFNHTPLHYLSTHGDIESIKKFTSPLTKLDRPIHHKIRDFLVKLYNFNNDLMEVAERQAKTAMVHKHSRINKHILSMLERMLEIRILPKRIPGRSVIDFLSNIKATPQRPIQIIRPQISVQNQGSPSYALHPIAAESSPDAMVLPDAMGSYNKSASSSKLSSPTSSYESVIGSPPYWSHVDPNVKRAVREGLDKKGKQREGLPIREREAISESHKLEGDSENMHTHHKEALEAKALQILKQLDQGIEEAHYVAVIEQAHQAFNDSQDVVLSLSKQNFASEFSQAFTEHPEPIPFYLVLRAFLVFALHAQEEAEASSQMDPDLPTISQSYQIFKDAINAPGMRSYSHLHSWVTKWVGLHLQPFNMPSSLPETYTESLKPSNSPEETKSPTFLPLYRKTHIRRSAEVTEISQQRSDFDLIHRIPESAVHDSDTTPEELALQERVYRRLGDLLQSEGGERNRYILSWFIQQLSPEVGLYLKQAHARTTTKAVEAPSRNGTFSEARPSSNIDASMHSYMTHVTAKTKDTRISQHEEALHQRVQDRLKIYFDKETGHNQDTQPSITHAKRVFTSWGINVT